VVKVIATTNKINFTATSINSAVHIRYTAQNAASIDVASFLKGEKGQRGEQGPEGPQGLQGDLNSTSTIDGGIIF
jgi:hypothetical protein